jgi:hypothetical protein
MARRDLELRFSLDLLDEEPETGVWCEPCALPSGVAFSWAMTVNDKPSGIIRRGVCHECGGIIDG